MRYSPELPSDSNSSRVTTAIQAIEDRAGQKGNDWSRQEIIKAVEGGFPGVKTKTPKGKPPYFIGLTFKVSLTDVQPSSRKSLPLLPGCELMS